MRGLYNQVAWAVVSLGLSGVMWLATHLGGQPAPVTGPVTAPVPAVTGSNLAGASSTLSNPETSSPETSSPETSSPDAGSISLRAPATVTLQNGKLFSGVIIGAESVCATWAASVPGNPDVTVTLPDHTTVRGDQISAMTVQPATLMGMADLVNNSDCGEHVEIQAS